MMQKTLILNEFKHLVQLKLGIKTPTPADCKYIASEIRNLTKKTISETTIKRIFGFASVKYNFSRYTLNSLSEFNIEIKKQLKSASWQSTIEKSREITNKTLSRIKNRSGIPYQYAINRVFSEEHLDFFLNSNYAFTCFTSQPGYGKTILLAKLAERFLSNPVYSSCSLLFLTTYDFLCKDLTALKISGCIKNELDIDPLVDLIEYVNANCNNSNSKLVIFIDSFNEVHIKSSLKTHLLERLHEFIDEIKDSYIQLVMCMRTTDWAEFTACRSYLTLLAKKWYPGDTFNPINKSNIPALEKNEISQILESVKGIDWTADIGLKPCLEIPLYLESYYELKKSHSSNNDRNIPLMEIVANYIRHRVDHSNYFTEKMYFLNKIMELTNFGTTGSGINKEELMPLIQIFGNAYKELVSNGILIEEHGVDGRFRPCVNVSFARPFLFEYFLQRGPQ